MTTEPTTPHPALAVPCPYEGGCGAPAGTPCYSSYGDTTHAERRRLADLRSLEHGTCALCGQFMVRGSVEGAPVDAWHPDPNHHGCPPMPDPATDWNGYALAAQSGLLPGHPGVEHFVAHGIPLEMASGVPVGEVHDLSNFRIPEVLTADGYGPKSDGVTDPIKAAQDAQIDRLHGPGAAAALDAAIADGSIFSDSSRDEPEVEVPVWCPECINGKCVNCDAVAQHPVTDELVPCTCTHASL